MTFDTEKDKITRLLTALLPDATIYVVQPITKLRKLDLPEGLTLAIDGAGPLEKGQVIEIKNILGALNLTYTINVIDLNSVSMDDRIKLLEDAIPWKN